MGKRKRAESTATPNKKPRTSEESGSGVNPVDVVEESSEYEDGEGEEGEGEAQQGASEESDGESVGEDDGATAEKKEKSFGGMFADILATETETPILSVNKKLDREIATEKKLVKEKKTKALEKSLYQAQGHVKLEVAKSALDGKLRKVANRGVVKLFNAIVKHQSANNEGERMVKSTKSHELRKSDFFDKLRGGTKDTTKADSSEQKWEALSDNYMMGKGTSIKEFDKEEESVD